MSSPYDQNPGQQQYGQPPQFGAPVPPQPAQGQQFQQPAQPTQPAQAAPAWGTQPTAQYPDPNQQNPYAAGNPYQQSYGGAPMQPAKKQRGAGAAGVVALLFRTVIGRLVIGLLIAGGIAAYHFATTDNAQRNSNGQVSQAGTMQVSDLAVGDCFDAPSSDSDISSMKAIPCSQAHDSQVYAEPKITESSYPGDSTLQTEAKTDCEASSAQASISSSAPSSLETAYYYPQDASTFADQSYILCTITSSSANLTQSYVS
jgi:hypothetical protein